MVKLAENIAENTRPTNSHASVGASAMTMKSMPRPRQDSRITGRRPKRSDNAPWIGAQKNWIAANMVLNTPIQYDAVEASPPTNSSTRCGSTGMITPNAITSISTVTKMKASAALRARPFNASVARGAFMGKFRCFFLLLWASMCERIRGQQ